MSDAGAHTLTRDVDGDDHRRGPDDAPVTLLEYGDYQCPDCGDSHRVVKAVQKVLGDDLRFAFRNFPLTQIHERAQQAAEAAEAAGAQDAFWEYHDHLLENQQALRRDDLIHYARDLKLDEKRLAQDIDSNAYAKRVRADFMGGVESDVNGTPTFFINGVRYDGEVDVDAMIDALRAATS